MMTNLKWSDGWLSDATFPVMRGGQGSARFAKKKDGSDPALRFVKELKRHDDPGRRQRLYREVDAYRRLKHDRVPAFVESNADNYLDLKYRLYVVTDAIQGETLADTVDKVGPLTLPVAIELTIAILDTLEYCHSERFVHRDIKPDNLMLRNRRAADPVLVDFGLSFNDEDTSGLETETDLILGNRFLSLPELGVGSYDKRSPVSDLTMTGGILLYALTGKHPGILVDHKGRSPHYRQPFRSVLDSLEAGIRDRLLFFFDQTFRNPIEERWQSATKMKAGLLDILTPIALDPSASDSDLLHFIQTRPSLVAEKAATERAERLQRKAHQLNEVCHQVARDIEARNYQTTPNQLLPQQKGITFGLHDEQRSWEFQADFVFEEIGTDLVVIARSKHLPEQRLRTLALAADDEVLAFARKYLLVGVAAVATATGRSS